MMSIEGRSHRELQAYGAACLAKYCAAKGIQSPAIEELVEHLLLLLTSTSLPSWEAVGCCLEIPGRGDPLPASLEQQLLPAGNLEELDDLVVSVVEVGLVDMYGRETDEPFMYALRARGILESAGVQPPRFEELFPSAERRGRGWGEPFSEEQYQHVRGWCMRTLKGGEVRMLIPNLVDRPAGEHETCFYDGFPLSVYEAIEARRSEVMQLVQEALEEYLGDDMLASSDGSFFPDRSKLTGDFYIEGESYSIIRRVEPRLYGISLQTHFFEHGTPPVEYLGLEVGLIYDPLSSTISHSGVDSSAL